MRSHKKKPSANDELAQWMENPISLERYARRLYDQHLGLIPYGCHRYKLPKATVYDAYMDSLVDLINQLQSGQFRQECSVATYLFQLFNNHCIKHIRDAQSLKRSGEHLPLIDHASSVSDPHTALEIKDLLKHLKGYADQINGNLWQILEDLIVKGYDHEEIAGRIGLSSRGSVASTKWRYLKQLQAVV